MYTFTFPNSHEEAFPSNDDDDGDGSNGDSNKICVETHTVDSSEDAIHALKRNAACFDLGF